MKSKSKKLLSLVIMICVILVSIAPVRTQAAVKLSETRKTLEIGQSLTLKVKGTNQKVKWSSDDTWVAEVNKTGKVTAKNEGTATITAKVSKKALKCKVTVKHPEIKVDKTTVYEDNNVSIVFTGITGDDDGYDINLEIQNLSSRSLEVQVNETSINGYMVDPTCSIEVAAGKKAKDKMSIEYSGAEMTPIKEIKNIETKFHIFDWEDDEFGYDTKTVAIMGKANNQDQSKDDNSAMGFEKEDALKCLSVSPYAVLNGAIATVKSTYDLNIELDITFAFYNSSGKLVDSKKAEYVQAVKGMPTNTYVESDSSDISRVKAVISDVRRGNSKNHPNKLSLTNKNGSRNGVSAQVNNIGDEDFEDVRLSCVFIKNGNPVACSVEYIERIPKNSHSFVTFDVPKQEKHLRDSDGDWYWDYVPIDCDKYAILIDYACYE